jgi:hypothetical protein
MEVYFRMLAPFVALLVLFPRHLGRIRQKVLTDDMVVLARLRTPLLSEKRFGQARARAIRA